MTYAEWLETCTEWRPDDAALPQHISEMICTDFIRAYSFSSGVFFEVAEGHYWTLVCTTEFDSGSFDAMCRWLWQEWAEGELSED